MANGTILLILVAALGWTLALPAAAYAAAQPADASSAHAFAYLIYQFGSVICHQREERSFHLFAEQLPVCARCTGLYAGAAIAAVAYAGAGWSRPASHPDRGRVRALLLLAALPMVLSLAYEWSTGVVPSNLIRAATGLLLGAVVARVVLDGAASAAKRPRK
jgi:uncharacterized membrane protein